MEIAIDLSRNMKRLLILTFAVYGACLSSAQAGTCTSISRTNASPNTVLTSTKYNLDLNTVYTQINSLDGGCLTDSTVELDALNATEFAVPLNAIKEGCKISRSDAATISVDKCRIAVNGNLVTTSSATTVTWGCTSCAAEATATAYYIYAKTGTSLDLLISTSAPDADGYSGTSKALGRFYNDGSGDIATNSIEQFIVSDFGYGQGALKSTAGTRKHVASARVTNSGTPAIAQHDSWVGSITDVNTGQSTLNVLNGTFDSTPSCFCVATSDSAGICTNSGATTNATAVRIVTQASGASADINYSVICIGDKP